MELIGLRIILTLICLALFIFNVNSKPYSMVAQIIVGGTLGTCIAGIWLWF